jgi:hypothetical protein
MGIYSLHWCISIGKKMQSTERKPSQDKDLAKLVQICKDIGIKLVESPEQIFKSMKEADIPVVEMTPDFFISFLKSHDTTHEDRCLVICQAQWQILHLLTESCAPLAIFYAYLKILFFLKHCILQ